MLKRLIMKKYIALLLILAVFISGIFFVKDYHKPNNADPTLESANLEAQPEEQPSPDSAATTEENYFFCALPTSFDSIQELVSALKAGTYASAQGTSYIQSARQKMDAIYVPAAIPDGFVLWGLDMNEYRISYFYAQEEDAKESIFPSSRGIVVVFSLEPSDTGAHPLAGIADQYEIPINEEGYIYSPEDNKIFFAPGNTRMAITVPDSMNNYDTLKSLCVVERIGIHTEVE